MHSVWLYIITALAPILLYIAYIIARIIRWFVQVKRIQWVVDTFNVGTTPHWFHGHLKIITGANEATLRTYRDWTSKAKEGAFNMSFGFTSVLVVCHPSTVKKILATSEPKGFITNSGSSYKLMIPWLGDGLLTSKGQKWFRNRHLLTPAFHFDILKPYMEIYNSCTTRMMQSFDKAASAGKSVNIIPLISQCTLNITRKCAFSSQEDIQCDNAKDVPYVKAVVEMSQLILERIYQPILYFDCVYALTEKGKRFFKLCDYSHEVANDIIHKRREELKSSVTSGTGRYVDFLDILLLAKDETGKGLSDSEILDEVETFMAAGHDTTASAISWILYNLARHPEIQSKVQQEIDVVMIEKSHVEWDDLNKIPYTTRCIKESMRIHPPVPAIDRELSKPFEISGRTLLPGTIIEINTYSIHHNPDVWGPDHMTFDPDRFLPDNMAKMDSHAFVPFSAGPRNCIGQNFAMNEIKTTVMQVLHKFDLSVDEQHKVTMLPVIVLRTIDGIKLYFKNRESNMA